MSLSDHLLFAVTAFLVIAAGWVCLSIVQQQREIVVASHDRTTLTLTQTSNALLQLEVDLAALAAPGSATGRDDVDLKLFLLRDNIKIVRRSEILTHLAALNIRTVMIENLNGAVDHLHDVVRDPKPDVLLDELAILKTFNVPFERLIDLVSAKTEDRRLSRQARLNRNYQVMFALMGALVVGSFVQILIVLRRHASTARLARRDALTGLPNRRAFVEHIDGLQRHGSKEIEVAVLLVDLDFFKQVNDSMGHAAGDAMLLLVAERLAPFASPTCLIARLGGDEFAIILEGHALQKTAGDLAACLTQALAKPAIIGSEPVRVSGSIGIAVAASADQASMNLLQSADSALYAAKAAGRGCYRFVDSALHDSMQICQADEPDARFSLAG